MNFDVDGLGATIDILSGLNDDRRNPLTSASDSKSIVKGQYKRGKISVSSKQDRGQVLQDVSGNISMNNRNGGSNECTVQRRNQDMGSNQNCLDYKERARRHISTILDLERQSIPSENFDPNISYDEAEASFNFELRTDVNSESAEYIRNSFEEQKNQDEIKRRKRSPKIKFHWVDDSETDTCMGCDSRFTFYLRRHHCRACGGLFCHPCSSSKEKETDLHSGKANYERICNACRQIIEDSESSSENDDENSPQFSEEEQDKIYTALGGGLIFDANFTIDEIPEENEENEEKDEEEYDDDEEVEEQQYHTKYGENKQNVKEIKGDEGNETKVNDETAMMKNLNLTLFPSLLPDLLQTEYLNGEESSDDRNRTRSKDSSEKETFDNHVHGSPVTGFPRIQQLPTNNGPPLKLNSLSVMTSNLQPSSHSTTVSSNGSNRTNININTYNSEKITSTTTTPLSTLPSSRGSTTIFHHGNRLDMTASSTSDTTSSSARNTTPGNIPVCQNDQTLNDIHTSHQRREGNVARKGKSEDPSNLQYIARRKRSLGNMSNKNSFSHSPPPSYIDPYISSTFQSQNDENSSSRIYASPSIVVGTASNSTSRLSSDRIIENSRKNSMDNKDSGNISSNYQNTNYQASSNVKNENEMEEDSDFSSHFVIHTGRPDCRHCHGRLCCPAFNPTPPLMNDYTFTSADEAAQSSSTTISHAFGSSSVLPNFFRSIFPFNSRSNTSTNSSSTTTNNNYPPFDKDKLDNFKQLQRRPSSAMSEAGTETASEFGADYGYGYDSAYDTDGLSHSALLNTSSTSVTSNTFIPGSDHQGLPTSQHYLNRNNSSDTLPNPTMRGRNIASPWSRHQSNSSATNSNFYTSAAIRRRNSRSLTRNQYRRRNRRENHSRTSDCGNNVSTPSSDSITTTPLASIPAQGLLNLMSIPNSSFLFQNTANYRFPRFVFNLQLVSDLLNIPLNSLFINREEPELLGANINREDSEDDSNLSEDSDETSESDESSESSYSSSESSYSSIEDEECKAESRSRNDTSSRKGHNKFESKGKFTKKPNNRRSEESTLVATTTDISTYFGRALATSEEDLATDLSLAALANSMSFTFNRSFFRALLFLLAIMTLTRLFGFHSIDRGFDPFHISFQNANESFVVYVVDPFITITIQSISWIVSHIGGENQLNMISNLQSLLLDNTSNGNSTVIENFIKFLLSLILRNVYVSGSAFNG